LDNGYVVVDEFQRTTCENIYCAGEPMGIGGVETALIEGTIAGHAATGEEEKAGRSRKKRMELRKFARSLNTTFELRGELRSLADEETIICRCENVTCGRLKEYDSRRVAKLQTRCGMGACQGRVCGPATEFLFGWEPDNVRPPIFPVRMENL
jgi:NADPH-dependent 2,4-dienoyl-CoA reductase/sulfur reductase-like enzyme